MFDGNLNCHMQPSADWKSEQSVFLMELKLISPLSQSWNSCEPHFWLRRWQKLIVFSQPHELRWPSLRTGAVLLVSVQACVKSLPTVQRALDSFHTLLCVEAQPCEYMFDRFLCVRRLCLAFFCLYGTYVPLSAFLCVNLCKACHRGALADRERQLCLSAWFVSPRRFHLAKDIFHTPAPLSTLGGRTFR